jgi:hypothetical protein
MSNNKQSITSSDKLEQLINKFDDYGLVHITEVRKISVEFANFEAKKLIDYIAKSIDEELEKDFIDGDFIKSIYLNYLKQKYEQQ